jgi:hypothetical protein
MGGIFGIVQAIGQIGQQEYIWIVFEFPKVPTISSGFPQICVVIFRQLALKGDPRMIKAKPSIPTDMNDPEVLRMALLIACIELTGDEYRDAYKLAEHFYSAAPQVLQKVNQNQVVAITNFAPVTF